MEFNYRTLRRSPHFQATLDPSLETEFKEYIDDMNTTQTWK